jgi:NitT/TauT family transport system permease protein
MKRAREIGLKAFQNTAVLLLFFALWELAARLRWMNPTFLPPFTKVVAALWRLTVTGDVWGNLLVSLQRSLSGYLLGAAAAIPLGLAIGWFKGLRLFLNPLLQVFRNLSVLALFPIFVMFFGIGETSKTVIIFWAVIWVALINTTAGVGAIDPSLVKAARSMGAGAARLFVSVIFPSALPYIFAGLRVSAANSILVLVAAEMIGASKGLGYALSYYQKNWKIPDLYAYLIVMAILGLALNYSLESVERRAFRWREDVGGQ